MKRILRYSLMLLGVVVAFTACKDEDSIERAEVPTGPQVFFDSELPAAYEINPETNSIVVTVSRYNSEGTVTVPITATTESTKYTFPESVTFEDGKQTADIVITYDPAAIEYGKYEDVTLALGDKNQQTPYGYSEYTFTLGVTDWDEWKPWNEAGKATYTYNLYWSGDDEDLPFYYRHNIIKPNIYQFRIEKWGYGVTLVFDWDKATNQVTCAPQYTGYDHSSYGSMYVADYTTYYRDVRGKVPGVDFDVVYGSFNEEEGIIQIPMSYFVSAGTFGAGLETITIGGYVRADVSCDVSYVGKLSAANDSTYVVANVELGADVTSAKVALVAGDLTDEIEAQILAGTYEGVVEVTESGEVKFPATDLADGKYTFVVISYLGEEPRNEATDSFKFSAVASAWKSLGMGSYTEDILGPAYTEEGHDPAENVLTYEVEIQESGQTPGIYRLVNPYGAGYPFNQDGDWDTTKDYYLEINASNPAAVIIEEAQEMGVDWGAGELTIWSLAAYYLSKDNAEAAAAAVGKLENGAITFPVKGILFGLGEKGWYSGNTNGAFKVVLPSANAGVKAKSNKKHVKNVTLMKGNVVKFHTKKF